MNSAIIGGKYGIWKLKDRIQLDEDAVLLDLFFEDSYSEEGFLPKKSFTRIDEFEYEKSKILWNFLKDKSIIDDKGILTKDYETLLNGLKFESSFNDFENEIREIVHYYKGWNGEGEFMLPDFSHFINFLQNLNSEDYIKKIGRLNDKK